MALDEGKESVAVLLRLDARDEVGLGQGGVVEAQGLLGLLVSEGVEGGVEDDAIASLHS